MGVGMDFEKVRRGFANQGFMTTMGVTLDRVAKGEVDLSVAPSAAISQQHGFVHGGAVGALADTSSGFAAMTMIPDDATLLTAEFKINFLAPARGERIISRGRVLKPGRTLIVVQSEVVALDKGEEKLVALMIATMAVVTARPDVKEA